MKNLESSIHNRCSTLCQAYVKLFYPDIFKQIRAKAEKEYENHQSRRNSKEEILAIVDQAVKSVQPKLYQQHIKEKEV